MADQAQGAKQGLFSRRLLLGGLLAGLAAPALANAPATSMRPRPRPSGPVAQGQTATEVTARPTASVPSVQELVAAARLGGELGFIVYDQRTGAVLESQNPGLALPPASVAKVATALFALDRLGADHRFVTRVFATGPVQGGMVQGDLILKGSGDPTLDTDRLAELAAALARAGVKGVRGRFLVDGTALPRLNRIDADQPEHVGYNPAISGVNLNFNRVHFEWKRVKEGWQLGMDARGQRHLPPVRMAEARIVERETPLFTFERRNGRESWTVAATALGKGGSRWLPVRDTETYIGEVFQTLCAAQGLRLPAPQSAQTAGGTLLAQVSSAPLVALLSDMLRHSTNLTAEVVGLTASGAAGLEASARQMNAWLAQRHGIETGFVDHSGLGGGSRISPQAMAGLVLRAPQITEILRLFPTREKGKGTGPTVKAKTGTLNFVSGLAGRIEGPRPLAFAIFAADTPRRDALPKSQRERPSGGPEWTRRARRLQAGLIERWAALYP